MFSKNEAFEVDVFNISGTCIKGSQLVIIVGKRLVLEICYTIQIECAFANVDLCVTLLFELDKQK